MQALKALVIFMGILILVGTTVVVVTIYNRLTGGAQDTAEPGIAALPEFGETAIAMPEGCRVTALAPADERLVLQLGSGGRCDQILILDMATGALLGRFTLAPGAE